MQKGADLIYLSPCWGLVEGCCECCNESLNSVKDEEWLDQSGSYHLLEDFAARI